MPKFSKRIISLVLSITVAVISCINASAIDSRIETPMPVIVISGDSNPIVDTEGNVLFSTKKIGEMAENICSEGETVLDAVSRIFVTFLKYYYIGCLTGNFRKYYDYIYESVEPIFGDSLLDCNGEPVNGSSIDRWAKQSVEASRHYNFGNYYTNQYRFYYDWRLDPLETADELNSYIKDVKAATGYEQVSVICRCLGANVFFAYVTKYGLNDIKGVGLDGVVVNGSEILSEPISGKFKFNLDAINRLLIDLNAVGMINVDSTVPAAVDMASKSGAIEILKFIIKFPNYNRIVKGITSSLSLSTFFTWPNYWAGVKAEDYQTALEYVFGPKGSEKRKQYAGLISKLDAYDKQVRQKIPELMKLISENTNLCIISKYGMQCSPISESLELVGDQFISAKLSSFGATTGTIYEPLTNDYVNEAIAQGKGKYISPDKQIDASTCMYPDKTFFIKGSSHSDWTEPEMSLLCEVICADRQLTIDDLPEKHFMVYSYETSTAEAMTTSNCYCENWEISYGERTHSLFGKIYDFFKSASTLFNLLSEKQ